VLDEHEGSRAVMLFLLQRLGCSYLAVDTVEAAFEAIATFAPHAVVYEWNLRRGTGRGLARRLRELAGDRPLAIVAVSSLDEPNDFCDDEQVDAYFTKPFLATDLASVVASFGQR
jgi:CheY-like chemotaxis protein